MPTVKISTVRKALQKMTKTARSAWNRGVAKYALDLIDALTERGISEIAPTSPQLLDMCLNGAQDWNQYSEGGCSLCYDSEIVQRLCNDSEKKRYSAGGWNRPNAIEKTWIATQSRALNQAFRLLRDTANTIMQERNAAVKAA